MTTLAILICLIYMAFFYGMWMAAYRIGAGSIYKCLDNKAVKVIFALFALFGLLLCTWLITKNRYVYSWDNSFYWTSSYGTMLQLFEDPVQTLIGAYNSVSTNEYNMLLPLFASLPLKIFGYTYTRYVILNFLLFLIPAWLIIATIVCKIIQSCSPDYFEGKKLYLVFVLVMVCITTFNHFYYPVLRGYIDVGCVVPALLSILLFIDYDGFALNKKQVIRDLFIAALLLNTFLFRRYFAYFIAGYAVALCLYSAYKLIVARNSCDFAIKVRNSIVNVCVIGFSAIVALLILCKDLVLKILSSNYSDMYAAYDEPFLDKVSALVSWLGLIVVVLAVSAVILCLFTKKARKMTLFCACAALVIIAGFFKVQRMDMHHIYTISIEFCILAMLGIYQITELIKSCRLKGTICVVISVLLVMGSLNCFVPRTRKLISPVSWLYSKVYDPLQRDDIDELHNLVDYVNGLTSESNDYVYVCASSGILNDSVTQNLEYPYNNNALNNSFAVSQVDARDGFSVGFLKSKYIIVTDPVQLHLAQGSQEVIRFLNQEVQAADSPIGKHFVKLDKSFTLDDGVVALVYKKVSDYEESDLQYLADYYTSCYPGKEELFADRILSANY